MASSGGSMNAAGPDAGRRDEADFRSLGGYSTLQGLFQNFSFERATIEKSSFVGPRPKNCKSFGKTNRVLQEALQLVDGKEGSVKNKERY
jgi:hypothetical protein